MPVNQGGPGSQRSVTDLISMGCGRVATDKLGPCPPELPLLHGLTSLIVVFVLYETALRGSSGHVPVIRG